MAMDQYLPHLEWIEKERNNLINTLQSWIQIHSGSDNLAGLEDMLNQLKNAYSILGGTMEEIALPNRSVLSRDGTLKEVQLGKLLMISKHPDAPLKVILCGHMDIAYSKDFLLEKPRRISRDILTGRGAADMKSGLLIALYGLAALEKSPFSGKIGWKVCISPDEEIGSPGSSQVLKTEAKRHSLGLVFEPSLPDGSLVSSRKGSANFTIAFQGRASHAGRNFFNGLNALTTAARFALAAESLSDPSEELTVNVGYIEGGGPVNIVPEQALCRINIRVKNKESLALMKGKIEEIAKIEQKRQGIRLTIHQDSEREPKIFDKKTRAIFESLKRCGASLGIKIGWKSTGGVCDGNTLAAEGLPTIDTLGGIGNNLHTAEECVSIASIIQRSKLTARFLM